MNIATHLLGPTQGVQIKRALERYPERLAFKDERGEQTYAEVYELIGRYQAVLEAAGLQRGDGVAALGANRFEVWALGSAVQSLGLCVTWLHPMEIGRASCRGRGDDSAGGTGRGGEGRGTRPGDSA